MEILLLFVIAVLIVIILTRTADTNTLLRHLSSSIHELENQVRNLREKLNETPKPGVIPPTPRAVEERPAPEIIQPKTPSPVPVMEPPKPAPIERAATTAVARPVTANTPEIIPAYEPPEQKLSWFETWLKNNPDIEKFIGENLINKIGIAVLVLGIAFFVKYAIDQNWINETGRVGIGLLCGGILIVLAHRMKTSYRSFSSVLVGGGLTVFYFTIAFAFHQYHLITQTAAFICMVVITAFAVTLSLLYNRIELAVLATIGGFITPFLVSTGQNNYQALFTYLVILNSGLIILAYFKNWKPLNFISLFFTTLVYGTWLTRMVLDHTVPNIPAFGFATKFYFLFLAMNMVNHLKRDAQLKSYDFIILLVINLVYYSAGLTIFEQAGWLDYKGFFTASLGIINLVLAYVLFKRKGVEKNFVYLLIGLTITYISLTAPVQLKGNYITLFWAAESVLLLWLYQKSFIKMLKVSAVLVSALMLISLFMDWGQLYVTGGSSTMPVMLNKGFVTTIFCAISAACTYIFLKKEADTFYLPGITNEFVRTSYVVAAIALLLVAGLLEINYQFVQRYPGLHLNYLYLQVYTIGFFTILFIVASRAKVAIPPYVKATIIAVLFILYLFNTGNVYTLELTMLTSNQYQVHFLAQVFGVIALAGLIIHALQHCVKHRTTLGNGFPFLVTLLSIASVVVLCIEVRNAYIWSTFHTEAAIPYYENLYAKAFLSILLGLSSFIMIWVGMKHNMKALRVTALVLFGITLLKLFGYDIKDIPPAGKIAAFILLGVLLLTISFMYQRLKKLLIDAPEK